MIELLAASSTTTAVPWWGIPVVAGAFGLAGVLGTLYFNLRRDKRIDNRRWERDLREVCSEVISCATQLASKIPRDQVTEGRDLRRRLSLAVAELQIIAPKIVVGSAGRLRKAAMRDSVAIGDDERQEKVHDAYGRAMEDFIEQVRTALGVDPDR